MALTEETKNGSGTTLTFSIEYAKTTDIKVRIDGGTPLTFATDGTPDAGEYYIANDATSITFGESQSGKSVHIYRETDIDSASAVFTPGSSIKSTDLNQVELVTRLASQEGKRFDQFDPKLRGELDMTSKKITELANPTASTDATNKTYVDTEISSATASLTHSGTSAPSGPSEGDRWFDTDDGRTYVYHNNQWIDAAPQKESAVTSGALNAGSKTDITVSTNLASWTINDSAVDTAALADNSVTLAKMTDGSVDTSELAALAVTSGKIAAFAVSSGKIANDAVTSDKLQDHATTDTSRAVTTNHIRDNNVTQAKIADDAINEAKLQISNEGQENYVLKFDTNVTGKLKWGTSSSGVTSVTAGDGLKVGNDTSGSITGSGTLDVDTGVSANKILKLNTEAKIPAVDGSLITNLRTVDTAGAGMAPALPTSFRSGQASQFLRGDGTWAAPAYTAAFSHPSGTHVPTGGSEGQVLKIDENGARVWAADNNTNTTYTAGTGLSLSGSNVFSVSGSYAASSHGTHVSNNSIDSDHYVDGSIDTAHIGNLQVTTAKLAADAVTGAKIGNDQINSEHYVDGSIDNAHIANLAVDNTKINNVNINKAYYYGSGTSKYQWVWTKLSQEGVNVKDFGAKGDGTTDDTTAIQNAINFVASWTYTDPNNSSATLSSKGGIVIFPAGKYKITSSLTISSSQNSITLQGTATGCPGGSGDDYGSRIISTMNDEYIRITESRGIHIKDLTFIGNLTGSETNSSLNGCPTGSTGGEGAIHVASNPGSANFLFENLVFHRIANCITLKGTSRATIRSCVFDKIPNIANSNVIGLNHNSANDERADQIRIEGCIIDGSPHPGFSGQGSEASGTAGNGNGGAYYSGTGTINSECTALGIYGFVNTVFVNQCSFIRCKYGVRTDDTWTGEFLYFGQVEVERANSIGWSIDAQNSGSDGARKDYITIDNCFASTNYGDAVVIGDGVYGSVNINTLNCRGNRGHGIKLACTAAQNVGIMNPIIGGNSNSPTNTNSGIRIDNSVHNVFISGGRIGGDGSLGGSGTQKYGIEINGTSHNNIRIIGTNVNANATGAIYVDSGWSGTGNKIQFNSGTSTTKDT